MGNLTTAENLLKPLQQLTQGARPYQQPRVLPNKSATNISLLVETYCYIYMKVDPDSGRAASEVLKIHKKKNKLVKTFSIPIGKIGGPLTDPHISARTNFHTTLLVDYSPLSDPFHARKEYYLLDSSLRRVLDIGTTFKQFPLASEKLKFVSYYLRRGIVDISMVSSQKVNRDKLEVFDVHLKEDNTLEYIDCRSKDKASQDKGGSPSGLNPAYYAPFFGKVWDCLLNLKNRKILIRRKTADKKSRLNILKTFEGFFKVHSSFAENSKFLANKAKLKISLEKCIYRIIFGFSVPKYPQRDQDEIFQIDPNCKNFKNYNAKIETLLKTFIKDDLGEGLSLEKYKLKAIAHRTAEEPDLPVISGISHQNSVSESSGSEADSSDTELESSTSETTSSESTTENSEVEVLAERERQEPPKSSYLMVLEYNDLNYTGFNYSERKNLQMRSYPVIGLILIYNSEPDNSESFFIKKIKLNAKGKIQGVSFFQNCRIVYFKVLSKEEGRSRQYHHIYYKFYPRRREMKLVFEHTGEFVSVLRVEIDSQNCFVLRLFDKEKREYYRYKVNLD